MKKLEPRKKINVEQVVKYLTHAFSKAQQRASTVGIKNARGTQLYQDQVEFCYLIDDIERGPTYIVPKKISEANELIEKLSG